MGFFDKVKDAAGSAVAAVSDVARDVSDKSKEMTEKARINRAIKNEEAKINNLYMAIGQKFFSENTSAPAGYESQFTGVNTAMSEIDRLKKSLETLADNLYCPNCKVRINAGQLFCRECGTKLVDAEPVQPANKSQEVVEAVVVEEKTAEEK